MFNIIQICSFKRVLYSQTISIYFNAIKWGWTLPNHSKVYILCLLSHLIINIEWFQFFCPHRRGSIRTIPSNCTGLRARWSSRVIGPVKTDTQCRSKHPPNHIIQIPSHTSRDFWIPRASDSEPPFPNYSLPSAKKGPAPRTIRPSRALASLVSQIEAWKQSMRRYYGYRGGRVASVRSKRGVGGSVRWGVFERPPRRTSLRVQFQMGMCRYLREGAEFHTI